MLLTTFTIVFVYTMGKEIKNNLSFIAKDVDNLFSISIFSKLFSLYSF